MDAKCLWQARQTRRKAAHMPNMVARGKELTCGQDHSRSQQQISAAGHLACVPSGHKQQRKQREQLDLVLAAHVAGP